ncbi:hypothetical protein VP01_516g9 [Puccinia sorghi]|uniref:Uncharacterized protein n=1 Tax=Puccinia sorghi TaxID=27349 RepID=A0A0L6UKW8_9BASI|nr:hypothetical protein VP01_516g9 [Puccinia sorghi]
MPEHIPSSQGIKNYFLTLVIASLRLMIFIYLILSKTQLPESAIPSPSLLYSSIYLIIHCFHCHITSYQIRTPLSSQHLLSAFIPLHYHLPSIQITIPQLHALFTTYLHPALENPKSSPQKTCPDPRKTRWNHQHLLSTPKNQPTLAQGKDQSYLVFKNPIGHYQPRFVKIRPLENAAMQEEDIILQISNLIRNPDLLRENKDMSGRTTNNWDLIKNQMIGRWGWMTPLIQYNRKNLDNIISRAIAAPKFLPQKIQNQIIKPNQISPLNFLCSTYQTLILKSTTLLR